MQWSNYLTWRRTATPIGLALVSLVLAIALWVAVTDAENPGRIANFGASIQVNAVNLPEGLAVKSIREPAVSLRISADENTFRNLSTGDFRAEIDLGGVRQLTSDQAVFVSVASDSDVEIIEVSPGFVTVELESVATKEVPVRANLIGSLPQGYSLPENGVEATPASVQISGAASVIDLVSSASVDINLTGLRAGIEQLFSLTPLDAQGAAIPRVQLTPSTATFRIDIAQQEVTLALTVVPQVQGRVASGYSLIAVSPDPPAVAVSGPLEALQALSFLTTEPVDVSGISADLTRSVRLRLPAGLQTTRDSVNVRLQVVPLQGETALTVAPVVTGLGEGLRATLQTASLTVRLRGDLPLLNSLNPASVRATVNTDGLQEGVHVLNPTISVPNGVEIAGTDPAQVVVVLARE
jgi:YbbR domain-containing protein